MPRADLAAIALVCAPRGRDASLAQALLAEAAIESTVCADLCSLAGAVTEDAGFIVTTIEAVRGAALKLLTDRLAGQPAWSDIPVILLTQSGGGADRNPEAARLSEVLGNVSFLERPFHPTTFVSVCRAAAKARLRQFEARSRLDEVREGEATLQTALLAGGLGSWQFDLVTQQLHTTAACKMLFGRGPDEAFTYDDLLATIHPEDRSQMLAAVQNTVDSGDDYRIEYRVTPVGQAMRWAAISARLVRDRYGAPLKMVGVSADITGRKTAEDVLVGANALLEQRVAERTAELERAHAQRLSEVEQRERAEALLHQAQKMEMIGQLTGGVAHDFNNLLMAVLGNLELLKKLLPDDTRANRLYAGAHEGALRGATLTQRLLAFARRQELDVKPRDLGRLVTDMADLLEQSAGSRVQIQYDIDTALPRAAVDTGQVELALMNLVINARDAMPDGGNIWIKVDCVELAQSDQISAGAYVRLRVKDEGSGMDAATLAKATDPFFSTKELGKGTGLGLSMIQGLAKQLSGALVLTSQIGAGTTAELFLPTTQEPAEASAVPPALDATTSASLRILVVDDDTLIAMSTVDMLEDLGHVVQERNSGKDALDYLATGPELDLVVTDYAMPQMTGLELARRIQRERPGLAVLLASGFTDLPEGDTIDLPRIAKPYNQRQLSEAIAAIAPLSPPV